MPWWWLLIAAALAALTAGAGATWWLRRRESQPSGPLIHVDSPFLGRTEASSGRAAPEPAPAHKRDFTATVVMTNAERARRVARGALDPESNANANASAVADADAVAPPAHNDAPRDTSDDPVLFNLPHFDKIATPSPAVAQAIAAASVAFASATATRAADAPVAPLKLDKNALTQQIFGSTGTFRSSGRAPAGQSAYRFFSRSGSQARRHRCRRCTTGAIRCTGA